jgi:peptide deformylase
MATNWTILTNPNPELRKRSVEIDVARIKTPEYQKFADEFAAYMVVADGVGLAAPQIGIKERIIAVQEKEKIGVYANPEILKRSPATQIGEEGCLSVPGVFGTVERAKRITVRAIDRHGRTVEMELSGFPAVIFQHEIDHLDGVLFIDKVKEYTNDGKGVKV